MKNYFEEFIDINGIRQYFLHYPGSADTVIIFMHGGPGQSEAYFSYLTAPTTAYCTFVFYDQRGTGKTQAENKSSTDDITISTLIEDLKETVCYIRKKYAPSRVILLGHSWGTILGMEYLKKYSNTVSAYIGMGQVVNFMQGEKIGFEYCRQQIERANKKSDLKKLDRLENYPFNINEKNASAIFGKMRMLQMKYKLAGYSKGNGKMFSMLLKSPVFSLRDVPSLLLSAGKSKNLMQYLLTYDTSGYTNFDIPIFFICGRNDWQVPSVLAEKYFSSISAPAKNLFWIENAGHLTDIENSSDYHAAVKSICQNVHELVH